ncbi:phosphate ABC transporter permease [Oscillatoria sp. FACHB-1407]|uniref:phosphate ABC transporter permease n=1 Tax=Oscillatoria sp. FACHB-1407 TaxID=2692847 RepID=UPI00168550E0|nr:phosphate ABC transporter permease [Oscillatoria sp. FACHB-1407]MBD2464343.1 phosphate ABC transporter permease [Oscillatoria sp. FACHB-1407]
MLIPITRETFEQMIPLVATSDQYKYYWGKPDDFLRRLLISVVGVVVVFILKTALPEWLSLLDFMAAVVIGLYWLWGPIYLATRRNQECRRYKYSGFWRGKVLDVYVTEELIGKEETVNKQGELVIVENRERRLNLEIGDETGFSTALQVPLQRAHRVIRPGDIAEMVVMSNREDMSRFSKLSDVFLSDYDLWVSDYPFLRRDTFVDVSRRLKKQQRRSRGR